VAAAQETLAGLSLTVTKLENSFNMGRDEWWEQLLSWLVLQGEEMELLSRIRDDLLENRVPGQESLINRYILWKFTHKIELKTGNIYLI
jgi:hypothetical protein